MRTLQDAGEAAEVLDDRWFSTETQTLVQRETIMRSMAALMVLGGACLFSARAAEPATELQPVMTQRGKTLASDDFDKALGKEWAVAKGKWEVVDGALRGAELKSDMHGAVLRHDVAFTNGVIQLSFKLDGAKTTAVSFNGPKGHVARVAIRPNGFVVQKDDQDGPKGPDKAVMLQTCTTDIKPGEWHTLLIEMQGKEMLATLDGKHTAYGEHDALDKPKTSVRLTASGESVSFKNFRTWEATPSKDWEKVREKYKATK
jgi:hypothetical protein